MVEKAAFAALTVSGSSSISDGFGLAYLQNVVKMLIRWEISCGANSTTCIEKC